MNASIVPFELAIERRIAAPPTTVYRVWTERLSEWWAPRPWTTELAALELWPGGRFASTMRGPDGEEHASEGVILEAAPNERILFTDAFAAGWRPRTAFMVGCFEFGADGEGTRYRASARHWDEASCRRHEEMGFRDGWTKVAEQLAELAESEGA